MEIALRRLDGIDKISISIAAQRFQLTYKPGATFRPREVRSAVATANVQVVAFRVSARGRVQEEGGRRYFLAGKERFLLLPSSPAIPSERLVLIEGIVDDSAEPLQLKVLQVR